MHVERSTEPPPGYWYRDQPGVDVLGALREFRRADEMARRRMSAQMGLNPLDMRALQMVIAAEREQRPLTPGDLSRGLEVSSAATTKLVDRLVASRHVVRAPRAGDRRSVVVTTTPHAHRTLRRCMSALHQRMAETAAAVPPECREVLITFLTSMAGAMGEGPTPSSAGRGPATEQRVREADR